MTFKVAKIFSFVSVQTADEKVYTAEENALEFPTGRMGPEVGRLFTGLFDTGALSAFSPFKGIAQAAQQMIAGLLGSFGRTGRAAKYEEKTLSIIPEPFQTIFKILSRLLQWFGFDNALFAPFRMEFSEILDTISTDRLDTQENLETVLARTQKLILQLLNVSPGRSTSSMSAELDKELVSTLTLSLLSRKISSVYPSGEQALNDRVKELSEDETLGRAFVSLSSNVKSNLPLKTNSIVNKLPASLQAWIRNLFFLLETMGIQLHRNVVPYIQRMSDSIEKFDRKSSFPRSQRLAELTAELRSVIADVSRAIPELEFPDNVGRMSAEDMLPSESVAALSLSLLDKELEIIQDQVARNTELPSFLQKIVDEREKELTMRNEHDVSNAGVDPNTPVNIIFNIDNAGSTNANGPANTDKPASPFDQVTPGISNFLNQVVPGLGEMVPGLLSLANSWLSLAIEPSGFLFDAIGPLSSVLGLFRQARNAPFTNDEINQLIQAVTRSLEIVLSEADNLPDDKLEAASRTSGDMIEKIPFIDMTKFAFTAAVEMTNTRDVVLMEGKQMTKFLVPVDEKVLFRTSTNTEAFTARVRDELKKAWNRILAFFEEVGDEFKKKMKWIRVITAFFRLFMEGDTTTRNAIIAEVSRNMGEKPRTALFWSGLIQYITKLLAQVSFFLLMDGNEKLAISNPNFFY